MPIKGRYRLLPFVETSLRILAVRTKLNGSGNPYHQQHRMTLDPNTYYDLPDDEAFLKSIKSYEIRMNYDKIAEETLKRAGVDFRLDVCKSCGGRVTKIVYNPIEVIENDESIR